MFAEEALLYETEKTIEGTGNNNAEVLEKNLFFRGSLDSIRLYMKDANKHKALCPQEENELAVRMQYGDTEARDKIIRSSLSFVIGVAHQLAGHGLPLEDLIQEGNMGLLKAVRRFNASKNYRFLTYARWWVRREMVHAIKTKTGIVAIPVYLSGRIRKVQDIRRKWEEIYEESPTSEDILKETGLSFQEIQNIPDIAKNFVFLDDPVGRDKNLTFGEIIADNRSEGDITEPLEREHRNTMVASWINKLKQKEKTVVALRYGFGGDDPMTLEAIGRKMGITRERVRQIEEQAHKKMRLWAKIVSATIPRYARPYGRLGDHQFSITATRPI